LAEGVGGMKLMKRMMNQDRKQKEDKLAEAEKTIINHCCVKLYKCLLLTTGFLWMIPVFKEFSIIILLSDSA
jgi:hypothetical protein